MHLANFSAIPVLVIGYNRPDLLDQILNRLLDINMQNIYVFIDCWKLSDERDKSLVLQCHSEVHKLNDKKVLKSKFATRHHGCYKGVTTAIDWFFSNEEYGVILEDDLTVDENIFRYLFFHLQKSDSDPAIGSISGFRREITMEEEKVNSDFLSQYPSSWGWATWGNRWSQFRHKFKKTEKVKLLWRVFRRTGIQGSLVCYRVLTRLQSGELDSWAYRWLFTHILEGWYSIVPCQNLVVNCGFRSDATHTITEEADQLIGKLGTWNEMQSLPRLLNYHEEYDKFLEKNVYGWS